MRTYISRCFLLSIAVTAMTFAGCNGSSSSPPSGMFSLSITDTPVDGASSVVVTFTGVEIQPTGAEDSSRESGDDADPGGMEQGDEDNDGAPSSGTSSAPSAATSASDGDADDGGNGPHPLSFTFPTPRQIDLMQQQGGNSASLLNGISLPAGRYAWIRLMVAPTGNTITLSDGSLHTLIIPSGDETGLKLVHSFTVAEGGVVNFTIDFDLRRSVILANGQYILKPVLRLMNNLDVGHISGSVANTFMIGATAITDPTCMPAAYIYAGADVVPVDINPTATVQPVATATVKLDDKSGDYVYSAGFLAPGSYTVALVCAAADNPATADVLTFTVPKNATVTSDATAIVDFP
ncbi:MAG: DUF4382 domain-containing protein [Gammaproteobacteria bacterium]